MQVSLLVCLASLLGSISAYALHSRAVQCTFAVRKAAVAQEIKTISSHSAADAAQIPLTPTASRTFYITPNELGGKVTLPPANVGVTADTVRSELVILATILNAAVPPNSVHYTDNANGSVTVDFIQVCNSSSTVFRLCSIDDVVKTDRIILPSSNVREIHEFDQTTCQIKKITGYVHGNLICPTDSTNSLLQNLCNQLKAASGGGK